LAERIERGAKGHEGKIAQQKDADAYWLDRRCKYLKGVRGGLSCHGCYTFDPI
jgi:hypothetical protein